MTDKILPIKVWLDGETYRELAGHAAQRGTDVGGLLAQLAAASIRRKGRYTRITPEMCDAARELRDLGWSWRAIASRLGCSWKGIKLAVDRDRSAEPESGGPR